MDIGNAIAIAIIITIITIGVMAIIDIGIRMKKYVILLSFLPLLFGCEQVIRRPPVVTDMMRGQAEENHATARTLNAYAAVVEDYARCTEAKNPKGAHSNIIADCGPYPTSPVTVTVTDSRKVGEVSQFNLMPPIPFLGMIAAVE